MHVIWKREGRLTQEPGVLPLVLNLVSPADADETRNFADMVGNSLSLLLCRLVERDIGLDGDGDAFDDGHNDVFGDGEDDKKDE